MKLSATQIRSLIEKKEDERVEFKRATFELPDNLWETYSAFCNMDGGTIILGIREGKDKTYLVEGVSDADPIIDEEDAFSVTVPLNDGYSPEVGKGMQGNDIKKANVGSDTANNTASGPLSGLKSGPLSGLKSGLKSSLGATDSKVIDFIRSNPNVTIKELQELLNLSRNGVRKALGRLKSMGRLRRVGPDKGEHWEVVEK